MKNLDGASNVHILLDMYYNLSSSIQHKYPQKQANIVISIFLDDLDNKAHIQTITKKEKICTPYFSYKNNIYIHPSIYTFALWWISLYISTPKVNVF
jgi:uridine kinase